MIFLIKYILIKKSALYGTWEVTSFMYKWNTKSTYPIPI